MDTSNRLAKVREPMYNLRVSQSNKNAGRGLLTPPAVRHTRKECIAL